MTKSSKQINLFEISQITKKTVRANKVKTTNVNILLNRVRLDKKIEFKKKIIFFSFLLLVISIVGIFSLI